MKKLCEPLGEKESGLLGYLCADCRTPLLFDYPLQVVVCKEKVEQEQAAEVSCL